MTLAHHRRPTAGAAAAQHRPTRSARGAALLEMTIAVGLLSFLLFGIISFGVTLSYKQTMTQAANEAARAAAVAPRSLATTRAEQAANRAIEGHGTPCNDTSKGLSCTFVIAKCSGTAGPDCMTVRLTYRLRDKPRVVSIPGVETALPTTLVSTAVVELNAT